MDWESLLELSLSPSSTSGYSGWPAINRVFQSRTNLAGTILWSNLTVQVCKK